MEYSSLEINISTKSKQASSDIKDLSSSLEKLKSSSSGGMKSLGKLADNLQSLSTSLSDLRYRPIESLANALQLLNGNKVTGNNLPKLADNITTLVDKIKELDLSKLRELGDIMEKFKGVSIKVSDIKKAEKVVKDANKINSGSNENVKVGRNTDSNSLIGADSKNETKKISKGFTKTILSSLKRIAFYRVIRSILKGVTSVISDGIKNLYNFSSISGGGFNETIDRLSSSFTTFKNSIGAVVSTFLVSFEPAINSVMQALINFNNVLARDIAILGGQKQYYIANTEYAQKYSNAVKQITMGFDELNTIGNNQDYSSMFELKDVDNEKLSDYGEFIKDIRDYMDSMKPTFTQLGKDIKYFADSFRNIFGWVVDINVKFSEWLNSGKEFSNIVKQLIDPFRHLKQLFESISNLIDKIKNIGKIGEWAKSIFGNIFGGKITVPAYANGGYVNSGNLFIANESGAEMVGSIGSHTAVANNDQIVEAVSQGVANAVSQVMANSGNQNVSLNLYLDGKQIYNSIKKQERSNGKFLGTGGLLYGN